jgi:TetR/AcrR family transcriptional regulator
MLVTTEGKVSQFVRSNFKQLPTDNWSDQWSLITARMLA